jgi:hypothetical protein
MIKVVGFEGDESGVDMCENDRGERIGYGVCKDGIRGGRLM